MDGVEIGENVRIQAYAEISNRAGSRIVIGDNTTLAPFSLVQSALPGSVIEIGRNCSLQRYSIIYGAGPVKVGDYCRIASHTTIVPVNKRFDDPEAPIHLQGGTYEGITLEGDVWVGSGVRILDGVRIGRGSILAAGAVVNRSFPAMSIVAGVPARLIRVRDGGETAFKETGGEPEW